MHCGSVAAYHIITNYKCGACFDFCEEIRTVMPKYNVVKKNLKSHLAFDFFFAMQFYKIITYNQGISVAQNWEEISLCRRTQKFKCNFVKILGPL